MPLPRPAGVAVVRLLAGCTAWALASSAAAHEPLRPPAPSPEARFEAMQLRVGERAFGLTGSHWTVYQGQRWLTPAEFALRVGDEATWERLRFERRGSTRRAVALLGLGFVLTVVGSSVAFVGIVRGLQDEGGRALTAAGAALSGAGLALYAGTALTVGLTAPRFNRMDRAYTRDEAEAWIDGYHRDLAGQLGVALPEETGALWLSPALGPGAIGVVGGFR